MLDRVDLWLDEQRDAEDDEVGDEEPDRAEDKFADKGEAIFAGAKAQPFIDVVAQFFESIEQPFEDIDNPEDSRHDDTPAKASPGSDDQFARALFDAAAKARIEEQVHEDEKEQRVGKREAPVQSPGVTDQPDEAAKEGGFEEVAVGGSCRAVVGDSLDPRKAEDFAGQFDDDAIEPVEAPLEAVKEHRPNAIRMKEPEQDRAGDEDRQGRGEVDAVCNMLHSLRGRICTFEQRGRCGCYGWHRCFYCSCSCLCHCFRRWHKHVHDVLRHFQKQERTQIGNRHILRHESAPRCAKGQRAHALRPAPIKLAAPVDTIEQFRQLLVNLEKLIALDERFPRQIRQLQLIARDGVAQVTHGDEAALDDAIEQFFDERFLGDFLRRIGRCQSRFIHRLFDLGPQRFAYPVFDFVQLGLKQFKQCFARQLRERCRLQAMHRFAQVLMQSHFLGGRQFSFDRHLAAREHPGNEVEFEQIFFVIDADRLQVVQQPCARRVPTLCTGIKQAGHRLHERVAIINFQHLANAMSKLFDVWPNHIASTARIIRDIKKHRSISRHGSAGVIAQCRSFVSAANHALVIRSRLTLLFRTVHLRRFRQHICRRSFRHHRPRRSSPRQTTSLKDRRAIDVFRNDRIDSLKRIDGRKINFQRVRQKKAQLQIHRHKLAVNRHMIRRRQQVSLLR